MKKAIGLSVLAVLLFAGTLFADENEVDTDDGAFFTDEHDIHTDESSQVRASITVGDTGVGELNIGGAVKTGLRSFTTTQVAKDKQKPKPTQVYLWNDDGGYPFRTNLFIGWKYKNIGAKFNLLQNIDAANNATLGFGNAYGWMWLFNDKTQISLGKIDDHLWGTNDVGTATDAEIESCYGVKVAFFLLEGFSFGAVMRARPSDVKWISPNDTAAPGSWETGDFTDYYDIEYSKPDDNKFTLDQFIKEPTFGAIWKKSDERGGVFNIGGSVRLKRNGNTAQFDTATGTWSGYKEYFRGVDVLAGFKLLAIPKTALSIDCNIQHLGYDTALLGMKKGSTDGLWVSPRAEGNVKLEFSVEGVFTIGGKWTSILKPVIEKDGVISSGNYKNEFFQNYMAWAEVKHKLRTGIDVGLYGEAVFVGLTGDQKAGKLVGEKTTVAGYDIIVTGHESFRTFKYVLVKPKIGFSLYTGLSFAIWDAITYYGANFGGEYPNGNYDKSSPLKNNPAYYENIIHVEFNWSF